MHGGQGARVGSLPHVPVSRAGRHDRDERFAPGFAHDVAEHGFGHGRAADVARAHEADTKERRIVKWPLEAHAAHCLAVLGAPQQRLPPQATDVSALPRSPASAYQPTVPPAGSGHANDREDPGGSDPRTSEKRHCARTPSPRGGDSKPASRRARRVARASPHRLPGLAREGPWRCRSGVRPVADRLGCRATVRRDRGRVLMVSDLTVSGGGTTRVATEELSAHAAQLRDFARATQGVRMRLAMLDGAINPGLLAMIDAPRSAGRANEIVDDCLPSLWFSAVGAEALATALDAAAEAYGMADAASEILLRSMAAKLAHTVGLLWPFVLAASTPLAIFAAGAWQRASEEQRHDALAWVTSHRGPLSDPRFVEFVRLAVSSADEFGAGAAGIPWEVTALLGDEALGILGFSTTVATVTGIARMTGNLTETPVKVEARPEQTVDAAGSFAAI